MEESKKPCKACKESIHKKATWCPHCNRPQSLLRVILPPPLVAGLVLVVGVYLLMTYITMAQFEEYEETSFTMYSEESIYDVEEFLSVSETSFQIREGSCSTCVTTIGKITNSSANAYTDAHFQISYYDATGRLIDIVNGIDHNLVIPPMGEAMFSVGGSAAAEPELYARSEVIISKVELDDGW